MVHISCFNSDRKRIDGSSVNGRIQERFPIRNKTKSKAYIYPITEMFLSYLGWPC